MNEGPACAGPFFVLPLRYHVPVIALYAAENMANHRIYQYTSLARPLDITIPTRKIVLYLLPAAALLGAIAGWVRSESLPAVLQGAVAFAVILYGSWALAREMDPDDSPASFISMGAGMLAALLVDSPGLLVVFVTLGLVRMVNRSSGLQPKRFDSIILMVLSITLIYAAETPLFGVVAAVAFMLDGSLKDPRRSHWVYGLVCLGGMLVYMVDHDIGFPFMHWPRTLFEWVSLAFILVFALDTMLMRKVRSRGDVNGLRLDAARVRGGMTVGFLAALQGISVNRPDEVVIVVATIAGLCVGIAFRKAFKVPAAVRH